VDPATPGHGRQLSEIAQLRLVRNKWIMSVPTGYARSDAANATRRPAWTSSAATACPVCSPWRRMVLAGPACSRGGCRSATCSSLLSRTSWLTRDWRWRPGTFKRRLISAWTLRGVADPTPATPNVAPAVGRRANRSTGRRAGPVEVVHPTTAGATQTKSCANRIATAGRTSAARRGRTGR
jgi:hypothetical protein